MYYFVFLLFYLIFVFRDSISEKIKIFASITPLIIIIIFRYGVGADYFSYMNMYESISDTSSDVVMANGERIETGFRLLLSIFKSWGISYQVFISVINILMLGIIGYWIYKESTNKELSWLLYYSIFFFVWILSAFRQGVVMAVGTYVVFSSKKPTWFKILTILCLSTIHFTALYYLLILVIQKMKFNRKTHLILLTLSLLITLLPLQGIALSLSNLPILSFLNRYDFGSSIGFFDFQSLIRLIMYFGTILFYNDIKESDQGNVLDSFLFGFYVYFVLKFSELIASRIFIYTFILCIMIFPILYDIVRQKTIKRQVQLILPVCVLFFSSFYFLKEIYNMTVQSGINDVGIYLPFTTKCNSTLLRFDKFDAFILQRNKMIQDEFTNYVSQDDIESRQMVTYNDSSSYALVNYPVGLDTHSGIIDQDGKWLLKGKYNPNLELYGDVLIKRADYGLFGELQAFDLTGKNRTDEEMFEGIKEYENEKIKYSYIKEEQIELDNNIIFKEMGTLFRETDKILDINVSKFETPLIYYVVEIDYYYMKTPSYIYLDENMELIVNFPVLEKSRFNSEGFLRLSTDQGDIVVNQNGDIIWWK